jgi:hypothetical protein
MALSAYLLACIECDCACFKYAQCCQALLELTVAASSAGVTRAVSSAHRHARHKRLISAADHVVGL